MSALGWLNPGDAGVEIHPRGVRVAHRDGVREWVLDRGPGGEVTAESRQRLVTGLAEFAGRKSWQAKVPALCGMAAGGVSLRRWKLPATAEDVTGMLRLQIESEFPLPPEELAWGWLPLGSSGPTQEILVAAVKRGVIEEYATLFGEAGLAPSFTLSALARTTLCSAMPHGGSMLHVGRDHSEWLVLDATGPVRLRVLPWGEENVLREIETHVGLAPDAAETLLDQLAAGEPGAAATPGLSRGLDAAARMLVALLPSSGPGPTLYLTGGRGVCPAVSQSLAARLGPDISCEVLERERPGGPSASLSGLIRGIQGRGPGILRLESPTGVAGVAGARPSPRRWAVLAAVGAVALLALPYAEALLLRPRLAARVESIKARQGQLQLIDRETDFLRHLKNNQTPHLDTLLVIGRCAPKGARIDSFHLNRKGELALRIGMRQPPEVIEFRKKMVESGFFASVVVEEQSPSPDRQKLLVRMSAQLKPAAAREGLAILATNAPAGGTPPGPAGRPPGAPPGTPVGMPPGMPAGMSPG